MTTDDAIIYIITKMELGGAQKVCLSLFNDLPKNSTITSYLITGSHGPLVKDITGNSHVIFLEQLTREVKCSTMLNELHVFFALIKHLRKLKKMHKRIIVHTHSTKAGLLGRWAAFFAGIKLRIHTVHGFGFNDFQPKIIWAIIYGLELITSFITTKFICVSQTDIDTGNRLFPSFVRKSCLIRAAVNFEQFDQPLSMPNQSGNPIFPAHSELVEESNAKTPFIFGTIVCFKKQKNLFDLLQAFEHVAQKHPQARLEIIGDGLLRSKIETWITQHQLTHAIKLHGWQEHVAPIAMNWHAFVLTSLWEGLPCAVVEARLLKLPVISYKTGGIPEIIFDQVNGLLYEQKNWPELAHGMITLIENQHLYAQLSAYPDNLLPFRNQNMINQHAHLYQELIKEGVS
jgi:glycosyltransferase involved in cell wall biosynthesis